MPIAGVQLDPSIVFSLLLEPPELVLGASKEADGERQTRF